MGRKRKRGKRTPVPINVFDLLWAMQLEEAPAMECRDASTSINSVVGPLPELNCPVGRHKAWVIALRSEYNDRVSHASSCDWDEDDQVTQGWDEQTGDSDVASTPGQPDTFDLRNRFEQSIDLERPIYRGLIGATWDPSPLKRHSLQETSSRRQSVIEDVDAQWLCRNPPLLHRQSAPDLVRLVATD